MTDVELAGGKEALVSIWRQDLPDLPPQRFDWFYRNNPAGRALCWLAVEDRARAPVGSAALVRRRFRLGDRTVTGGIVADFSVLPGHRGFGPALDLQRKGVEATARGDVDFAYGTPNAAAAVILKRVGYREVGWLTELTFLLRSGPTLRRRLGRAGGLARAAAPVADGLLLGRLGIGVLRRIRRSHQGEVLSTFDTRFDGLWERMARSRPGLMGERHADFLRWRFQRSPRADHRIFALSDVTTGKLAGYVVHHEVEGRAVIDDLACLDLDRCLDDLLLRFLAHLWSRGAEAATIRFFGDPRLVGGLRRAGFLVRDTTSTPVVVYAPEASPLAEVLADPVNWWLLTADNDY